MNVTRREPSEADLRKMDHEQIDALAREIRNAKILSESQYNILEEQMRRDVQRRVRREI